jgi:SET domain-containing protein
MILDRAVFVIPTKKKMLYIDINPKKGRGVFTDSLIPSGAVIERCPVIEIPAEDRPKIDASVLYDYCYDWGPGLNVGAVALGYGSLYNHSHRPNARYFKKPAERVIEYVALRDIQPGEEIETNYNGDPNDLTPIETDGRIQWDD